MARSVAEFTDTMLALLPHGIAWPRDPDSTLGQLLAAFAVAFAQVDARNEHVLREMDPRSVHDWLDEWETDFALPGPCITTAQSFTERRSALVTKYRLIGDQSRQFFIDMAAQLGYEITITEFDADNPGPQTEYNGVTLAGDDWNFIWQINAPLQTSQQRIYGSAYGMPYRAFGNELLECTLRGIAHDHRVLFFSYS